MLNLLCLASLLSDSNLLPITFANHDDFASYRRIYPKFQALNFRQEAELIQQKKSKLSANDRKLVLEIVDKVNYYNNFNERKSA